VGRPLRPVRGGDVRHRHSDRLAAARDRRNPVRLRTLLPGPSHGHAIAKHIQRTSEDLLEVETGSLYPALYRLEAKGWIAASWQLSDKGKRARYYRIAPKGRKQLAAEQSKWTAFVRAMGLLLKPADEDAS
jgi:PadR family transcriptional regulator, regulatory protein PadR